ncbi:unnamed protein product [Prorocentrum cordatum]|uniref:Uncharacterized protein n=1 Tax=Prorocentrum cordatum TaxID=2364126 RepID=A0ABN9VSF5_9DINO|nr:unnamed protein product [Polarella glacialis]
MGNDRCWPSTRAPLQSVPVATPVLNPSFPAHLVLSPASLPSTSPPCPGFPASQQDPSALLLDALRALCGTGPGQAGVVQAMAFGNYDATSGTGWALLRARRASGEGLRGGWRPRVGSYAVAAGPDGGPLGAAVEGELSRRAEGDRGPLPAQVELWPPPLGDALPGAFRELTAAGHALEERGRTRWTSPGGAGRASAVARLAFQERFGSLLELGGALRLDFAVQQGKLWAVSCRAAGAGGPAAPGCGGPPFAPRCRPGGSGCGRPASAGTAQLAQLPLLASSASVPALCPARDATARRPTSLKGDSALRLPALLPAAARAQPSLLESQRGVDRGRRKVCFTDKVSYCPELPE